MDERDPDTLPDSSDLSGPCPRCQRTSNFTAMGEMPSGWVRVPGSFGSGATDVERVAVLLCQGCGQGTVVIEEKWLGKETARQRLSRPRSERESGGGGPFPVWRPVHWWPPPGAADLDEAIPHDTRHTYAEALRCLSVQAYRAGVVMLRRTLETVVHDKGSEAARKALERNLAAALTIMAEDHALDPNLAAWAAEIRLVGNVGAHYDPADDVAKGEADDLQHLTRRLLEYVYEMPARIRRSRPKS